VWGIPGGDTLTLASNQTRMGDGGNIPRGETTIGMGFEGTLDPISKEGGKWGIVGNGEFAIS